MSQTDIKQLFFVTWPDGNVFVGSETIVDESAAIRQAVLSFLPREWFGDLDLGQSYSMPLSTLWKGMKSKGFKVHTIDIPTDFFKGK